MNDLIAHKQTMTSREIAELTGKQHKNVIRDIDNLLESLSSDFSLGFKSTSYIDSTGKSNRMFELDREASICLVAGYDANARMLIVRRWLELEEAGKPKTVAELLVAQAQRLLQLERRQAAAEAEANRANDRLDRIETAVDYFTVIGYARYVLGQYGPLAEAAALGKRATQLCRERAIPMGETPDPRFGRVNVYPRFLLEELFEELFKEGHASLAA